MKIRNLVLIVISVFSLNACIFEDADESDLVYQPTLIEMVCQTAEISTFCKLIYKTKTITGSGIGAGQPIAAWKIQFSGRGGYDAVTGEACASDVETVFAPSDTAFAIFFANFPHWLDSTGTVDIDKIPTDSVSMIVFHHMFSRTNGIGAKLYVEIENPVCSEERILRGSNNPYKMMDGKNFIFAENATTGAVAALSEPTSRFSIIESPDMATTDGAVYIVDKVLGPF